MSRLWLIGLSMILAGACSANTRKPLSPELDPYPRPLRYAHNYELFQTKNGLIFAFVPEARTNLVSVDVRYLVGAAEDPTDKEGLAHFVEHLMFQLTSKETASTIGDRQSEAALFHNAYTNYDETHYTSTGLKESVADLLRLEAERMSASCNSIDDARIERERQVVKRELSERETVESELRIKLSASIFPVGHPYRRRVAGSKESIDSITRADICEFIDAHYGPARAILIVSGNFEKREINRLVTKRFGGITKVASQKKRASIGELAPRGSRTELHIDVKEPAMVFSFPVPAWGSTGYMIASFFFTILENRILNLDLAELGITSVSSTYLGGYRGGAMGVLVGMKRSSAPEKVANAVFEAASKLRSGADQFEVDYYRSFVRSMLIRRHEAYRDRATNVADYLQYTKHNRFILMDLERVQSMPTSNIESAARIVTADRTHISVIRPRARGRALTLGLGDVGKSFDLEPWRSPVDPAQANRPVATSLERPAIRTSKFKLANGLAVVFASDFSYPTIDFRFVIPAGTASDPVGKAGTARLAARLLDDDVQTIDGITDRLVFRDLLKMGGLVSSVVNEDYTLFSIRGMSQHADGHLWQLYFRLNSGAYNEESLRVLKNAAKKADAEGDRDDTRVIRAAVFGPSHPYARKAPRRAVHRLSRGDLERFRARHFQATGSTLIVSGNFDEKVMKDRIVRLFGSWKATPVVASAPTPPPARRNSSKNFVISSSHNQPRISIAFALNQENSTEAQRLVLRELLHERLTSIREQLGASYGIRVHLLRARGPWLLLVDGEVEAARAPKALVAIRASLEAVRVASAATAPDFVRARRHVLERLLADTASAKTTADELEHVAAYGLGDNYYARLAADVGKLTHAELSRVAASELSSTRAVTVLTGPSKALSAMAAAAGLTNLQEAN